jgi:hypothetical protein
MTLYGQPYLYKTKYIIKVVPDVLFDDGNDDTKLLEQEL